MSLEYKIPLHGGGIEDQLLFDQVIFLTGSRSGQIYPVWPTIDIVVEFVVGKVIFVPL